MYARVEGGWETQQQVRPRLKSALLDTLGENCNLPEVGNLLAYLWEHGACKMRLAGDDDEPTREHWENSVCHKLVGVPLMRLWDQFSVLAFSRGKSWRGWHIPQRALHQLAAHIAAESCGQGRIIRTVTPFANVQLVDLESFEIEPGVVVKMWSDHDQSWYWYLNEAMPSLDEFMMVHQNCAVIEMTLNEKQLGEIKHSSDREESIGAVLARVKWAMSQVVPGLPIIELPTTIRSLSDGGSHLSMRRQNSTRIYPQTVSLRRNNCFAIKKLLTEFKQAQQRFEDLHDIIWMFDRSTLAVTSRDALLEATIGLERLLVNGSGENGRRFRTYGAAMLPGEDATTAEQELNKIYALRSNVAHGTAGNGTPAETFYHQGKKAKAYFSAILRSAITLVNGGHLLQNKKGINGAIETYLNSLLYAKTRQLFMALK